jgi:alpha-tubulin suppressor-like RCC1 family protein
VPRTHLRLSHSTRLVAAIVLLVSILAAAPASAASRHLSITATPATALVRTTVVVSGTLAPRKAGVRLVLQRQVGKAWVTVAHTITAASGAYAIKVPAPKKAVSWVVRATTTGSTPAVTSKGVRVRVVPTRFTVTATAPRTVAAGAATVVTGSVKPKATGTVVLQRLSGRTWTTVGSAKLSRSSSFTVSHLLSAGTYHLRVLKAFSPTVAAGLSKTQTVQVAAPTPAPGPAPVPLSVTVSALPAATVGVSYTTSVTAAGGTGPYSWALSSGSLPDGLLLSTAGVITGLPTRDGAATLTVTVTDAKGTALSSSLPLTIAPSAFVDDTARAWGRGFEDELGNGVENNAGTPVAVSQLTGVAAVTGGAQSGFALRFDGTVYAWGSDTDDQLGDGGTQPEKFPIPVSGVHGATAIAAGTATAYALRYDGTVYAWGKNDKGQLGNGAMLPTTLAAPVQGLTGVKAIAAGANTAYALLRNGTVWSWGANDTGQLGNGGGANSSVPVQVSGLTDVTAISSGLALHSDGTVSAWGSNSYGRLGDGTIIERDTPAQVAGLTGVIAIAEGSLNGYALTDDHQVWAWGFNTDKELGRSTPSQSLVPLPVPGATDVIAIAGGTFNCYGLLSDHTEIAWGWNLSGQLGNGNAGSPGESSTVAPVSGLSNVVAVGAGPSSGSAYAVVAG